LKLLGSLFFLLLLPFQTEGAERVSLYVANMQAAGWQAQGMTLVLEPLEGQTHRIEGRIARLELETLEEVFEDVRLSCPEALVDAAGVHCTQGALRLTHPWVQVGDVTLAFGWQAESGHLSLDLKGLRLGGGRWHLAVTGRGGDWQVDVDGKGVDLTSLRKLLRGGIDLSDWKPEGRVDLGLELQLDAGEIRRVDWALKLRNGSFAGAEKAYEAEELVAQARGESNWDVTGKLVGSLDLTLFEGALWTPFALLMPGANPLHFRTRFSVDAAGKHLELNGIEYRHPSILKVDAVAGVDLEPFRLRELHLTTDAVPLARIYRQYFQPLPVLTGTPLESVDWRGSVRLVVDQSRQEPLRLQLDLDDVAIEDAPDPVLYPDLAPRFVLTGIDGRVSWSESGQSQTSRVSWSGGKLLGAFDLGAATLQGRLHSREFRLTQPIELPVLDGQLLVDRLVLNVPKDKAPQLDFDGILTPVTMERISKAFGWPPLAGSVSGVIPGLSLRDGRVKVAGKLLVRIFDGDILISGLSLSHLFGVRSQPALRADVEVKGLDLETLTRTFSFGKITGRLDGRVDGLYLEDWAPVAFDARFQTPPKDDASRTISQRAVDNISNLGGAGIGGSLSRTFLGMFEAFRYQRLGISCRLQEGVCHMGGVAPAKQGYYLVVGSGLPQINIVGFNTRTDWDRLVEQLQQISASGPPVVDIGTDTKGQQP
jgi:hypothetical protein